MKIQLVTHRVNRIKEAFSKCEELILSEFDAVDTFDSYDVNVIDLTSKNIWSYKGNSYTFSNEKSNLESLWKMIDSSKKTRFLFVFPQNIKFFYDYERYDIVLRDNINGMAKILSSIVDISYSLAYEPNKILIGNNVARADFYFSFYPDNATKKIISIDSEKVIAFECNNNIYTTANVLNPDDLLAFIAFYMDKAICESPEWFKDINFNNDASLKELLATKKEEIEKASLAIEETNRLLDINTYYKSILFETGETLVKIVFDIFKNIAGIDLHDFVDKKKEDFNCLIDDTYFVGEIKGVSENVKRKHLSELEDHKQDFMDRNSLSFAKGLLIINHQRNKAPSEREEVYPDQITYAKKDELLIIESTTLLKIYECFLKGELNVEKFKKSIKDITGILKDEWK